MAISNKQEGYSMPLIDARRGFVYGALYDNDINSVYIGYIDETLHAEISSIQTGTIYFADFQYNSEDDTMDVQSGSDDVLTDDNIKTIFNKSIIGKGNITLFRHKLKLSDSTSTGVRDVILDYISTSNLVVDSLQDLQELLNVSRGDTSDTIFLGYKGVQNYTITYQYSTGIFVLSDGTNDYNTTSVSDKVTTI